MDIPKEWIIEILIRLKLEGEQCKCERHAMDFYTRFAELIAEKIEEQVIIELGVTIEGSFTLSQEAFMRLFGEKK